MIEQFVSIICRLKGPQEKLPKHNFLSLFSSHDMFGCIASVDAVMSCLHLLVLKTNASV